MFLPPRWGDPVQGSGTQEPDEDNHIQEPANAATSPSNGAPGAEGSAATASWPPPRPATPLERPRERDGEQARGATDGPSSAAAGLDWKGKKLGPAIPFSAPSPPSSAGSSSDEDDDEFLGASTPSSAGSSSDEDGDEFLGARTPSSTAERGRSFDCELVSQLLVQERAAIKEAGEPGKKEKKTEEKQVKSPHAKEALWSNFKKMYEGANPLMLELAGINATDSEIWDLTGNDEPKWRKNTVYWMLSQLVTSSFRSFWRIFCALLPRRASAFLRLYLPQSAIPNQHTWRSILGDPTPQTTDGTCSICAITVGIESVHRMAYERIHGPGAFPLRVSYPSNLTRTCRRLAILTNHGSYVEDVLDQVIRQGGVPTTSNPRSFTLAIQRYEIFFKSQIISSRTPGSYFAQLLFTRGPCIATLCVESAYFDMKNYEVDEDDGEVYRRASELRKLRPDINTSLHAVICYAYKSVGKELHVRVLDNQDETGPRRWVLLKAFEKFFFISVGALGISPDVLQHVEVR